MSKILFINGNLYGHFNPTLPVVTEFVKRGSQVWYICADIFKEKVEAAGAGFISLGEEIDEFYRTYKPTGEHPFYKLIEYIIKYNKALLPIILDKISNLEVDFIVYDSILGPGYFLQKILKVPGVCSNSSFAMKKLPVPDRMLEEGIHPQLDEFYKVLHEVCSKWNVKVPTVEELFINKGDWNLVYTSKEFNSASESFDNSYLFLGPMVEGRWEEAAFPLALLSGEKVIYISLGTINTDYMDFYKICMEAFGEGKYRVVLAVGNKCDINSLGNIPGNIIVRNYVPQLEILKNASVFISHGGFNSVSEALYYQVPVIAIPMVNDQHMTAKRVVELGAGISLKMSEITAEVLRESVHIINSKPEYYDACRKISESLHIAAGCEKAVETILKELEGR